MRALPRIVMPVTACLDRLQNGAGLLICPQAWPLFANRFFPGRGLERMHSVVGNRLVASGLASLPLAWLGQSARKTLFPER